MGYICSGPGGLTRDEVIVRVEGDVCAFSGHLVRLLDMCLLTEGARGESRC